MKHPMVWGLLGGSVATALAYVLLGAGSHLLFIFAFWSLITTLIAQKDATPVGDIEQE